MKSFTLFFLWLAFALVFSPSAKAAITAFSNQNISIPSTFDGVYVDLQSGTSSSSPFADADLNFFFGGAGISNDAGGSVASAQFLRNGAGLFDMAVKASFGSTIGPNPMVPSLPTSAFSVGFGASGNVNNHLGSDPGQFTPGERGFLGFSVDLDNGAGGSTTAYGYADVTLTANTGGGIIHGWLYDDEGAAVLIPEPSAGLLVVLFSLALVFGRRRA